MSSFIICWLLPLPYTVGILIVFLAAINVHLMNYCILYSGLVFSFGYTGMLMLPIHYRRTIHH